MIIVRYADDFIVGFQHEADARRFLDMMRERLQEFALSLHPEKTRLIEFGRLAAENRKRRGLGKPETFTFLGFIFICSKTRQGKFQIKRKTRRDRMRAKLQAIKQELRRRMHQPIPEQGKWLRQVTGYFNYHAVPTNGPTLTAFLFHVTNLWRRTLRRRSCRRWWPRRSGRRRCRARVGNRHREGLVALEQGVVGGGQREAERGHRRVGEGEGAARQRDAVPGGQQGDRLRDVGEEGVAEIRRLGAAGGECQVDGDGVAFGQRGAAIGHREARRGAFGDVAAATDRPGDAAGVVVDDGGQAVWAATLPELGSAIDTEKASLPSNRVSLVVGSVKLSEVTAGLEKVRVPPDSEMPCPEGSKAIACATSVRKASPKSAASVPPAANARLMETVLPSASVAPP